MIRYERDKCRDCKHFYYKNNQTYCDLAQCMYTENHIKNLFIWICKFLIYMSIFGLFMIGIKYTMKLFSIDVISLIIGLGCYSIIYLTIIFIMWLINKINKRRK